jgi:N-acetylglucosaminyldiphosphoundecaprenol N-acetyl-beta-D-mannosaminyltransferase
VRTPTAEPAHANPSTESSLARAPLMSPSPFYLRSTPPDFSRDVHCVFGLPFDVLSEDDAVVRLRSACERRQRTMLSTPNLSFASGSMTDEGFRMSVVNSDLCTADGAPIVLLARLLGAPLPHRVTGSNVFQRLTEEPGPPISVYFFGGTDNSAALANERLNQAGRPWIRGVGHCSPGFGSLESMSGPAFIDPINAAKPDFVVVALGARKGQAWIGRNWPLLEAPVIGYLGAVVNFTAGTVERAPRWVQRSGVEWLWRIKEEPALWRRYWGDGKVFLRYLLTQALPWVVFNRSAPSGLPPLQVAIEPHGQDECVIKLSGAASNGPRLEPLRTALTQACSRGRFVTLDLRGVTHVGTSFVGLLQLLDGWQRSRSGPAMLTHVPFRVARALHWAGASYLLVAGERRAQASVSPAGSVERAGT